MDHLNGAAVPSREHGSSSGPCPRDDLPTRTRGADNGAAFSNLTLPKIVWSCVAKPSTDQCLKRAAILPR